MARPGARQGTLFFLSFHSFFRDFPQTHHRFRASIYGPPSTPDLFAWMIGLTAETTRKEHFDFGGADGIRTHDLLDAIEARSQLRHGPTEPLLMLAQAAICGHGHCSPSDFLATRRNDFSS
jgi:hypothetical protein